MPPVSLIEPLKPMELVESRDDQLSAEDGNSPSIEKPANDNFVMDVSEPVALCC